MKYHALRGSLPRRASIGSEAKGVMATRRPSSFLTPPRLLATFSPSGVRLSDPIGRAVGDRIEGASSRPSGK